MNFYYPFGMPMPGREYVIGNNYRFSYNGKEKDDEIKGLGNSIDFGARIYDPRLGRWLSIDRLAAKYPNWSPYNFAINNPIAFKDPDGNDVEISVTAKKVGTTQINLYSASEIKKDATLKNKTTTVPVYEVIVKNECGSVATFYFTRDAYRGQTDGSVEEVTFNVRNDKDQFLGKVKSRWEGTDNVLELSHKDDVDNQSIDAMKADVDAIRTAIQFHVKGASDGCLLCVGKDQFESIEKGSSIDNSNLKSSSKDTQEIFMNKIKEFRNEDKDANNGSDINILFEKVNNDNGNPKGNSGEDNEQEQ